jgi:hypothetical protein
MRRSGLVKQTLELVKKLVIQFFDENGGGLGVRLRALPCWQTSLQRHRGVVRMSYQTLLVEKTKRIGTVRFNRPKAIAAFGLNSGIWRIAGIG